MYVELCSQRPVHAHGVAERMRRTCAACRQRVYGGEDARVVGSLCVALCAMHSSSSYQPSPPPIRVQSSSPPSPLPALRPALRPLASSVYSPLLPPALRAHNLAQPHAQPICTSYYTLAQLYITTLSTRLIRWRRDLAFRSFCLVYS